MPTAQLKSSYEDIRSSDFDRMSMIEAEFKRAYDVDNKARERNWRNWRAYFAVDGGQWEPKEKDLLEKEDRTAAQYNVMGQKVDTLTGSLSSEQFDLDWKPIEGVRNSLTEAVKSSFYSDKELCEYDNEIAMTIRDAMVYKGVLKMKLSNKHNPLWNIDLSRVMPGYVIFDPYWIEDEDFKCDRCWEIFHLPAHKIASEFDIHTPRIDDAIKQFKRYGGDYQNIDPNFHEQLSLRTKGHLYRVIEYHWMETIKTQRIVGQVLNTHNYIPFPITKDEAKLEQFMLLNKVDPNTMFPTTYNDKIHHVTTICPELTPKILQDGLSKIQVKRLPYFQLTANRALGKDKGVVDDMYDIQETINKRESKISDLIETANGGGKLVNEDLFRTPAQKARFKAYGNDPKYVEFVRGEELSKERAIHYINSNQYPSQVINQLERMYDVVMDKVSKVPPSMEAMSESSNESGVLFRKKLQVAGIATVTIMTRLQNFRKHLAEAYYYQWQMTYTGPEREFTTQKGDYKVVLNKKTFNNGRIYIENRPDMIPRCKVICTVSKSSPNQMMADQAAYAELYNLSTQTNPDFANLFYEKMLKTMDLDEETQERIDEIALIQRIRDRKKIIAELANFDAAEKQSMLMSLQSSSQIGQMMANMGMQPPQETETARIAEDEIPQTPPPEQVDEEEVGQAEELGTPTPADVGMS